MQKKFLAGAAALVALGLSAGGAFTAGNTVPASVAGYGSATVSGATVDSISYSYTADKTGITGARLVFTADQSAQTVEAAFDTTAWETCTQDTTVTGGTTFDCAFTGQSVADATNFHVSVS